ncbi:hypothetical protein DPX16_8972 [Anabarilius grahami]|uniref:Uncharacterized protein n=1 Tax=Anabarilius grahami TaxID=495550 RepID=A0A3N0XCW5_ANAGA|nr:hypothetical protein DPX16_8972 [Anabarilius grahami]
MMAQNKILGLEVQGDAANSRDQGNDWRMVEWDNVEVRTKVEPEGRRITVELQGRQKSTAKPG